jgi:hypothetical protein
MLIWAHIAHRPQAKVSAWPMASPSQKNWPSQAGPAIERDSPRGYKRATRLGLT